VNQTIDTSAAELAAGPQTGGSSPRSHNPAPAMQFFTEQPTGERLARVFLGNDVQNAVGERVGDIHDFLFDDTGRITLVVLGVGGFLGIGEKIVAVPFSACTFGFDHGGARIISIELGKDALMQAPAFNATEKTILDSVKDKAADLGHKTADKAAELREQAARKILDMTKCTYTKP
jgi:PRC-barrel domain